MRSKRRKGSNGSGEVSASTDGDGAERGRHRSAQIPAWIRGGWVSGGAAVATVLLALVYSRGGSPSTPTGAAPAPGLPRELIEQLKKGDQLAERGDHTAAAAAFRAVLYQCEESRLAVPAAAHFNAATTFAAVGLFDRAQRHYMQALEGLPKAKKQRRADVYGGLAIVASKQQDRSKSIELWRKALGQMPRDENFMFYLGRELERVGKHHEAEARYRNAVAGQTDPSPRFLHFFAAAVARRNQTLAKRPLARVLDANAGAKAFHDLALEIADTQPEFAVKYFAVAQKKAKTPTHARAIVYSWGRTLAAMGREADEQDLYTDAVEYELFADPRQRPLFLEPSLLPSQPWPSESVVDRLQDAIQLLESNAAAIKAEWLSVSRDSGLRERFTQSDSEALVAAGGVWRQGVLKRDGKWELTAQSRWPHTYDVVSRVQSLGTDVGEGGQMPKAAVEFSAIAAGSELTRHCGPSNHRIRLHLGLLVPEGTGITVAGETRTWTEGKVLTIDDSWEHSVFNRGDLERVVLIVDVWHPQLNRTTRDRIRSLLGSAGTGVESTNTSQYH
eukprot:m.187033 g.187033  ORF g.187033 m.187033 type:complete len:559 (+) comp24783_c0_seq1:1326-3002(+)